MAKQLIVVVHGVGVRDAGVATGQLSAVLSEDDLNGETPSAWIAHSTDDFLLHEAEHLAQKGLLTVFPAHLRRFKRVVTRKDGQALPQERVIADFFWGDISGTGLGGLQVLIGLIKIVLGLSHAVRKNANGVFAGPNWQDRWLRGLARAAALMIHGPIVAINLVLFGGVGVTLLWHTLNGRALAPEPLPELGPFWTELVTGLLAIGIGIAILRSAQVFLLRFLAGSILITGLAVLLIDAVQALFPAATYGAMSFVNFYVFASPQIEIPADKMASYASGFPVLAGVLMGVMVGIWVLALGIAWITRIACLLRGEDHNAFVSQAISLMSLAWLLLMTAGWSVLLFVNWAVEKATGFHLPEGLKPDLVMSCLRLATPAGVGLLLLAAFGIGLQIRKGGAFAGFRPASYLGQRGDLAERHRMIVARALLGVLDLFLLLITLFFIVSVVPDFTLPGGLTFSAIRDWNAWALPYLVFTMGLATLAAALVGRKGLAAGVAIFTDVLVYLNNASWDLKQEDIDRGRNMAWGRRFNLAPKGLVNQKARYWLRDRIHARMVVLMAQLIRDEKPDEIVIVSHSQGTVIALDVIDRHGRDWIAGGGRLKLVTMGSPYLHLYSHYFGASFPDASQRPELAPRTAGGVLQDWINIFRVDDFVGTHIDSTTALSQADAGRGWPREHPVPPGGHTNYWVDVNVIPILQAFLPFRIGDD